MAANRWVPVLMAIAVLQLGLGGILAVTMSDDDPGDAVRIPGLSDTTTTTSTPSGSGTDLPGDPGTGTIPSTDPANGGEIGDEPVVVTSPPRQTTDTRPSLPSSR